MARIIETATGMIDPAEVDPVTLDLIENSLRNARYEMDEVLFRTALSPGIREQHDEFPLIGDPEGKMVVGQFGLSIPALLDRFEGTIAEGDVLLTSDPYSCDGAISHANDWLVVMPIYVAGRLRNSGVRVPVTTAVDIPRPTTAPIRRIRIITAARASSSIRVRATTAAIAAGR